MRFYANLFGYQAVWWVSMLAAAKGLPWIGVAGAVVFVLAQWVASGTRSSDARLVACALLMGIVIDGFLGNSGLLRYASADPSVLAPIWILSIWAAFAMTFNHSFVFLQGRPAWGAALGAIGGPLAYEGAARLGAVQFTEPSWRAIALLGLAWGIVVPALAMLAHRWRSSTANASFLPGASG
jgi:hypothetical protein